MEFTLRDDHIKLGQLLKAVGWVESGAEAKEVILDGQVAVNGETSTQRGKKCFPGDVVEFRGQQVEIAGSSDSPKEADREDS